MAFLLSDNFSKRTVNRKISSLKAYFQFLWKQGEEIQNPFVKTKSLKTPRLLVENPNEEDLDKLFSDLDSLEFENQKRDKLLLALLYCTGIRREELINIKLYDFQNQLDTLKVLGKRKKERIIPVNSFLKSILKVYLAERIELGNNYLFQDKKGNKLNPKFVYSLIKKYLNSVSTISSASPHKLRHAFATHMLDNGADINSIKELLGHSSLAATQVYTHNSIEKLKLVYEKTHPKS